jgi:hypothetical protein
MRHWIVATKQTIRDKASSFIESFKKVLSEKFIVFVVGAIFTIVGTVLGAAYQKSVGYDGLAQRVSANEIALEENHQLLLEIKTKLDDHEKDQMLEEQRLDSLATKVDNIDTNLSALTRHLIK